MASRTLRYVPLDELRGNPANPKGHLGELIGASLDRFGLVEPQTMDGRTGLLSAGHGRLKELKAKQDEGEPPPDGVRVKVGKWLVPVVFGWESANDEEALAYLVASNQSTIAGGWDYPALGAALDQVRHTDLSLAGTGYTTQTLDDLLASLRSPLDLGTPATDDEAAHPPPAQRVKPGEVWQLGPHRLLCGDARDPGQVDRLLAGAVVNVAFTSPPYAERRKYDESSGFVPVHPDAYVEWFAPVAANVAAHLADDGSWFVNIKAGGDALDTELYVLDLVAAHVREWGWHLLTEFCWERNGVPKQVIMRFKNQFEPIYQLVRGRPKVRPDAVRHASDDAIIPFGPGAGDTGWANAQGGNGPMFAGQSRKRSHGGRGGWGGKPGGDDVQGTNWQPGEALGPGLAYPGNRLPTFAGSHEATGHTAAFPVGLPAWFLRAYSDEGDVLFDPFVGSGSSILAAEQEGRIGYGVELSPGYCDIILDRWERHDGAAPVKVDG